MSRYCSCDLRGVWRQRGQWQSRVRRRLAAHVPPRRGAFWVYLINWCKSITRRRSVLLSVSVTAGYPCRLRPGLWSSARAEFKLTAALLTPLCLLATLGPQSPTINGIHCVCSFFFFFTSPLSCWSVVGTVSSVTMTLMGSYDVASLGICSCCLQAEELWHTMSLLISSVFTNYHPAILYLLYIGFLGVLDTHFMTAWAMNITRKGKAFYFGIFFMILLANSRFEGACSLNLTLSIHVQLLICQKDQI